MPEDPELEARMSSALGPSSRSEEGNRVVLAERARQSDRVRKYEKRAASRRADLAASQARSARIAADAAKEEEDLNLARHGLRRSFWTGRVIPVSGSRRARAHQRRLSKGLYVNGGE